MAGLADGSGKSGSVPVAQDERVVPVRLTAARSVQSGLRHTCAARSLAISTRPKPPSPCPFLVPSLPPSPPPCMMGPSSPRRGTPHLCGRCVSFDVLDILLTTNRRPEKLHHNGMLDWELNHVLALEAADPNARVHCDHGWWHKGGLKAPDLIKRLIMTEMPQKIQVFQLPLLDA